jgi:hypothetical protein
MELAGEGGRVRHASVIIPKWLKWLGDRTPKRSWSTSEECENSNLFFVEGRNEPPSSCKLCRFNIELGLRAP